MLWSSGNILEYKKIKGTEREIIFNRKDNSNEMNRQFLGMGNKLIKNLLQLQIAIFHNLS